MKTLTLTAGQGEFFDKFKAFVKSKNVDVMILRGYAGTGKTFLVQHLLEWLDDQEREYRLMAPTGRASKVLSSKAKQSAYTIHKSIYSFSEMEEQRGGKKNKRLGNVKYHYKIRFNDDVGNAIYIVDEASMVNDLPSEGEMYQFGSGSLLKDLVKFAHQSPEEAKCRRKILFVGDPGQLPPVGAGISYALVEDYLKEKYDLNCESFQLTEVVRQGKDSGILEYATNLRNSMLKDQPMPYFNFDKADIHRARKERLVEYFERAVNKAGLEEVIVVTFSNRLAMHYNQQIRQRLFPGATELQVGDRLMFSSNNYSHEVELLNGDFATVLSIEDETEFPIDPVMVDVYEAKSKQWSKEKVPLQFRDVVIEVQDNDGDKVEIECKMMESLLNSPHRDITSNERKALYQYFRNRHPKLKPGTKKFNEMLAEDPYFNALRLKYGYAITGHKAQGGEWEFVFVDFQGSTYMQEVQDIMRWRYTAVTRAKGHLLVLQ
ncbi:ATP-dependent DNA helicase [Persicobacter psychrovividus]|uniref:ATP-dependent endonuclease n=1 Tax=Persicobacter psychrovividus TaxID=387638 RepID=A0ABM7VHY9_9BACT|nr:ATP-dependent endonuclease [Persicobacter psychrovividus]